MKRLIEFLIKKLKNPDFSFDINVSFSDIWRLLVDRTYMIIRGAPLLIMGKTQGMVFVGSRVVVKGDSRLGRSVTIGPGTIISGLSVEGVRIGNNVNIGGYSMVIASTSFDNIGIGIRIGNNVSIGEFAYLGGAGGLEIGDDTIVGQYLSCHPENHNYDNKTQLIRKQGITRKGIKIGQNCWIGSKVTFLDGASVGDNSVVAAGSLVTQNYGPNVIVGGVPAKLLKRID